MRETITNQDEAKLLGYFESTKSVFLLKMLLIAEHTKSSPPGLDPSTFRSERVTALEEMVPGESHFFRAFRAGNAELLENLRDDAFNGAFSGAWNTFEMVIKDLARTNYVTIPADHQADYHRNEFGFTKAEKRNLDLFYYIRNAMSHYNGAYWAGKAVDCVYRTHTFVSEGHIGEKIEVSVGLAYAICTDLETYAMKAWTNAKRRQGQ